MYKVKFTFKIPKVHCQKVRNANYTKNLDFDPQVTFGQLLTFGQIVDKSQCGPYTYFLFISWLPTLPPSLHHLHDQVSCHHHHNQSSFKPLCHAMTKASLLHHAMLKTALQHSINLSIMTRLSIPHTYINTLTISLPRHKLTC